MAEETTKQEEVEVKEDKSTSSEDKKPSKKKKKKQKISLNKGIAYVSSTYNNTIISLADTQGNVVAWCSAGKAGFKGPKKSTPYAAGIVVRELSDFVKSSGLKQVDVIVKGVGMGRDSSIRGLSGLGLKILSIKDKTPVPHNGPRAKKPRRV